MEKTREKENPPSLPSNYVSLLQLRDRWLKDKERNQEKEESGRPERKVQEHEGQGRKHEVKHGRESEVSKLVFRKVETHLESRNQNNSRLIQSNSPNVVVSNPCTVKETCSKSKEVNGEILVSDRQIERNNPKKKNGWGKNPRAESREIERASGTPGNNLEDEMRTTECKSEMHNVKKNKSKKKNIGNKSPRAESVGIDITSGTPEKNIKEEAQSIECKIGVHRHTVKKNNGIEDQCGPEPGNIRNSEVIQQKSNHISQSLEIGKSYNTLKRTVYKGTGAGNRNFRYHQNLHRPMVWVRKDEL